MPCSLLKDVKSSRILELVRLSMQSPTERSQATSILFRTRAYITPRHSNIQNESTRRGYAPTVRATNTRQSRGARSATRGDGCLETRIPRHMEKDPSRTDHLCHDRSRIQNSQLLSWRGNKPKACSRSDPEILGQPSWH